MATVAAAEKYICIYNIILDIMDSINDDKHFQLYFFLYNSKNQK